MNATRTRLDPRTSIGAVDLAVSDLDRSIRFYQRALGFQVHAREGEHARLGAGGRDLVRLEEVRGARRVPRTTGLYHFAVLLPGRTDLATALVRLAASGAPLGGASDHGVSEALYLSDPDGNGIEIYRDRPRQEWPRAADGSVAMTIDALDLQGLLHESPAAQGDLRSITAESLPPAPAETTVGHVHLHVADLDAAKRFYADVLGFDVVTRYGAEALFVSAGGYHHHVGLNTWAGKGASPPPPGSAGLRWFAVEHPSAAEREETVSRVREAGIDVETIGSDYLVRDPSGNGVRLTARS
ncbi:MAG TPA: VOC family protein [Candidatus Eisenbacteria bacterium]|nr:VOC family protein [Candidatus Eisenbacteria bacterium]